MLRSSIKLKFAAGSIGIIILMGLAVVAFVRIGVARHLEHKMVEKGAMISKHLAHMAAEPLLTENYISLQMLINDFLIEDIDVEYIIVTDPESNVIAHTFGETFPADLIEANVLMKGSQLSTENLDTERGQIIDMAVPVLQGDVGVVRVGFSKRHINETIRRLSNSLLIVLLAVMGAGGVLSFVLGNAITKPIAELKSMTEEAGEGNLDVRAEVRSEDEVGHLASSFNLMTLKLKVTRDELEAALMELEHYSRNLENIVSQRTADLTASNERLEQEVLERKKTEEKLLLTQFAVDNSSDAVFWVDSEARFMYVNEAACNTLGYSKEELLSMTVHDIDPDFPKEVWPSHWQEIKKRGSFSIESRHRRKDGVMLPVEITVNYLNYGGREYNCSFARDITERKKAEDEIRESEQRYRTLVESSPS